MSRDILDMIADTATHQRATVTRNSISIRFGTNDVRRGKWDGTYPVRVYRVDDMGGRLDEEWTGTCHKKTTLARHIANAGRGWRVGAVASWVELRTGGAK